MNLDSQKDVIKSIQELKIHEQIISSLKNKANLKILVIQMLYNLPTKGYAAMKLRLRTEGWFLHKRKITLAENFSVKISTEFDLIIGLSSNYYQSNAHTVFNCLSPMPTVVNGMSPNILVDLSDLQYALQYINDLFTVEPARSIASRKPAV
jgi:hypothetical protein